MKGGPRTMRLLFLYPTPVMVGLWVVLCASGDYVPALIVQVFICGMLITFATYRDQYEKRGHHE